MDTKRINILLDSFGRKPSNTTKIIDTLEKKALLEIRSDGLHSHKTFCLTHKGEVHGEGSVGSAQSVDWS